jgi:transcriptional regulator with XRE-family HTH domain
VTSPVHQIREALGHQLRDLRKDANLTGAELASRARWGGSKVSKIEHGRQTPSEDDIRDWCRHTGATDQAADLIATVRNIESMYLEWRRTLGAGTRRRQQAFRDLEARANLLRWYEPVLIPGLLHTAEYTAAVIRRVIDFYRVPDDLDQGLAARLERQEVLYRADHRFHFVIAQQALRTMVGGPEVMAGQLDRLLAVMSLPRVIFGVIPANAEYRVPTNQFIILDDQAVNVETVSAELVVTQPREINLYVKAFSELHKLAVYGKEARAVITSALADLAFDAHASTEPPHTQPPR